MDEAQTWAMIEEPGKREPLITRGEARATVALLHLRYEQGGPGADAAVEPAAGLGCRPPPSRPPTPAARCPGRPATPADRQASP